MPPSRVFGPSATALDGEPDALRRENSRSTIGRMSLSGFVRRPSILSRWTGTSGDEESGAMQTPDKPAIPSALQPSEAYSTPLPALSMVVLSIVSLFIAFVLIPLIDVPVDYVGRVLVCERICAVPSIHGRG